MFGQVAQPDALDGALRAIGKALSSGCEHDAQARLVWWPAADPPVTNSDILGVMSNVAGLHGWPSLLFESQRQVRRTGGLIVAA